MCVLCKVEDVLALFLLVVAFVEEVHFARLLERNFLDLHLDPSEAHLDGLAPRDGRVVVFIVKAPR